MNLIYFDYNIFGIEYNERGRSMTEQLVAVQRNHFGDIISFQTSSGRVISYRKAMLEVEEGIIEGVSILEENNSDSILTPSIGSTFNAYPIF
jgi:hypothetical protein